MAAHLSGLPRHAPRLVCFLALSPRNPNLPSSQRVQTLDRCFIPRVHRRTLPLVPRYLRQLPLPYSTCRRHSLLHSPPLWRRLHGPRYRLPATDGHTPPVPRYPSENHTRRHLQRSHFLRKGAPLHAADRQQPSHLRPFMGSQLPHRHVLHGPNVPFCSIRHLYIVTPKNGPHRHSRPPQVSLRQERGPGDRPPILLLPLLRQ